MVGRVVELAVLLDVEARGQSLDARHDVVGVAPELSLLREPRARSGAPQATPGVPIG